MKKKEKKTYSSLCPRCGLTVEIHEKFPLRFYLENDECPHCHTKYDIVADKVCNILNVIMALFFLIVMEEKLICLGILGLVALYIMCSYKVKKSLIRFKYFKFIKK